MLSQNLPSESPKEDEASSPVSGVHRRIRLILILSSIVGSLLVYLYVLDWIDTGRTLNVFSDINGWVAPPEFTFFSGAKGGFYIKIGKTLERRTEQSSGIRFKNQTSSGGLENARRVASTSQSFGFMQEDSLAKDDFLRSHIRLVTPLYLERLHIIYDTEAYANSVKRQRMGQTGDSSAAVSTASSGGDTAAPDFGKSDSAERGNETSEVFIDQPVLSGDSTPEELRNFFRDANVSTGPVGSGSRIFARYLLTHCNITEFDDKGLMFSDALARLSSDGNLKVDVLFTIAGAPLEAIRKVLQSEGGQRFRLMSIDPTIIPGLRDAYSLRVNVTDFRGKYAGGDSISTFGSWAFLIASKDVSDVHVSAALSALHSAKDDIRREMDIDDNEQFQLSEFQFYESFKIGESSSNWRFLRNALIFFGITILIGTLLFVFMSWLISGAFRAAYNRRMTRVSEKALEDNLILKQPEEDDAGFPRPVINEDQGEIISRLVVGTSELSKLVVNIRKGYDYGELTFADRLRLLSGTEELRAVFQRHLSRRLNEFYSNYGEYDAVTLRHYFTAEYLSSEDFRYLADHYGRVSDSGEGDEQQSRETRKVIGKTPKIFISYRREETRYAVDRIRERLEAKFGDAAVFQDVKTPAGRDYRDHVDIEISRCDILLAVIGDKWASSMHERVRTGQLDLVRTEVEAAMDSERTTVIPVILAPATMPADDKIPTSIRRIHYLTYQEVRPDPDFHTSMDQLIEAIMAEVGIKELVDSDESSNSLGEG